MTEVACAIITENSQILAVQRSEHMPHPLKWEFPGGKLKEGESPEYCIKREIYEELGLRISVKRLLPSVKHDYGSQTIKLIPFICTVVEGEISLSEHKSYRWLSKEEVNSVDWLEADIEVVNWLLVSS